MQAENALCAYLDEETPTAKYGRYYYPAAAARLSGPEPTAGGWLAMCAHGQPERVSIGDLGWAVLLVGRPRPSAAAELLTKNGVSLTSSEDVTLAQAANHDFQVLIDDINALCSLSGIGIANAAKLLHIKRPALMPVLDRTSGFGTYFSSTWRVGDKERAAGSGGRLLEALKHLRALLSVESNGWRELDSWTSPAGQGPFTRVQLWDMVWWSLRHRPTIGGLADQT